MRQMNKEFILEIVKLLRWPSVFLIAIFIFLLISRKALPSFLGRITKISKKGIDVSFSQQKTIEVNKSYEELMHVFDSTVLLEQEANIKKDLETKDLTDIQKIEVLIRHLAATQRSLLFESIDRTIWGSQIKILEYLNANTFGVLIEMIKPFYENAATQFPRIFADYSFEDYFNFLISQHLIVQNGAKYFITERGRDFLSHLIILGRPLERAF